MHGITGREGDIGIQNPLGMIHHFASDREDIGKEASRQVVNPLPIRPSVQCPVPMQNFLQDLGVDGRIDLPGRNLAQKG